MFKFKYFHTPKARQFNLKPRYHDPEKEEREKRLRALEEKHANKDGSSRDHFSMTRARQRASMARAKGQRRLIIIILLLCLAIYFLYGN